MLGVLLALPFIFSNQFQINVLETVGIYFILAVGLNVVVGSLGLVSIGQAGLLAIGGYTSALITTKLHLSFWLGLGMAAVVTGLAGALLAIAASKAKGVYLAMVTIAFGLAIWSVASHWTAVTGGPMGIYNVPSPSLFGYTFGAHAFYVLVLAISLLVYVLTGHLDHSYWGRSLIAIRGSEVASEASGMNVYRRKIGAFVLGAVYAGVAGALFAAQNNYINSDSFTYDQSVFFLVMVVLGGAGTRLGPLLGSFILTMVNVLFAPLANYDLLIYGAILFFAILFIPSGVVGALENWWEKKHPRTIQVPRGVNQPRFHVPATEAVNEPVLQTTKLVKRFGGITAVNGVDITVKRGTIHALIGPNGSGKSTMINLLTGVYTPTAGTVKVSGVLVHFWRAHHAVGAGIARTFQNLQIFPDLLVIENVAMGVTPHLKSTFWDHLFATSRSRQEDEESRRRSLEYLEFMGIGHLAYHKMSTLAQGHRRLVEIARALATEPRLLLLDEPAAGLVHSEVQELGEHMKRLRQAGLTILVIEHHIDLLMEIADWVTVLDYGKVIADGLPQQVAKDPAVIRAYLGDRDVLSWRRSLPDHAVERTQVLSIHNLVVSYGAGEAVKHVNLHLNQGEIVSIVGSNGAGKSSILKAILNLAPVKEGEIQILGNNYMTLDGSRIAKSGIALVPEARQIFTDQTVEDNLILGFMANPQRGKDRLQRLMEQEFARFPILGTRKKQQAGTLSGGEQQMLAISRALMSEPKVILLDEPSLGLAPQIVDAIFDALVELNRQGISILLVEQMAASALAVSDRAYVLQNGKIVHEGSAGVMLQDESISQYYLGA